MFKTYCKVEAFNFLNIDQKKRIEALKIYRMACALHLSTAYSTKFSHKKILEKTTKELTARTIKFDNDFCGDFHLEKWRVNKRFFAQDIKTPLKYFHKSRNYVCTKYLLHKSLVVFKAAALGESSRPLSEYFVKHLNNRRSDCK